MVSLNDIHSNDIKVCVRCGMLVEEANDSGWEAFLPDGYTTQPICIFCDEQESRLLEKEIGGRW